MGWNKNSFLMGLAAGIVFVCLALVGYNEYGKRVVWQGTTPPNTKVLEIFDLLDRYSIIAFEREEMFDGMYRGLLDGVDDPYTQYFDQDALEAFRVRTEGVFAGIGVTSLMDESGEYLTVYEVFDNSPAHNAGLLAGDKFLAVDGESVVGQPQGEITDKIRGPEGTTVRLTMLRPDEYDEDYNGDSADGLIFDVHIVRAMVEVPTVFYQMPEDGIGLIRIDGFARMTLPQFNEALDDLIGQGIRALIIDVRNNPGGSMPAVVQITNRLVPEGIITYTEHADGRREYHRATEEYLGLPLVVLVNGRSASASEILAAAVQDTGAGTIIGTQTYGKGSVQNLMYLSDGHAVKMTIAKYFTPNGISIHGIGVTPDVVVEMDEALSRRTGMLTLDEDVQLQAAIYSLTRR
ncbi:MAG: S41 family peptidase [Defluviitaleaceae bacterium]|nr:S41 family peptidase [Defluviitaleaceae bacterium]